MSKIAPQFRMQAKSPNGAKEPALSAWRVSNLTPTDWAAWIGAIAAISHIAYQVYVSWRDDVPRLQVKAWLEGEPFKPIPMVISTQPAGSRILKVQVVNVSKGPITIMRCELTLPSGEMLDPHFWNNWDGNGRLPYELTHRQQITLYRYSNELKGASLHHCKIDIVDSLGKYHRGRVIST